MGGKKLCLLLLVSMLASPAQAQWTLWWRTWQDTQLENVSRSGGESIERDLFAFAFHRRADNQLQQIAYVHEPLLVTAGEPAHNGYFHRLDYTLAREHDDFNYQVIAGVHGSSNMYKHADFHKEALVITGQIRYPWDGCGCELGVNGDYRFGRFQPYPTLSVDWQLTSTTQLIVDLPYQLKLRDARQGWQIGIERYGNKWGALDKDREVESAYYLEEWQVMAQLRLAENLYGSDVFLQTGYSFDTTIRYRDLLNGEREEDLDSAYFVGLRFAF